VNVYINNEGNLAVDKGKKMKGKVERWGWSGRLSELKILLRKERYSGDYFEKKVNKFVCYAFLLTLFNH
jgi:hypothetical protein